MLSNYAWLYSRLNESLLQAEMEIQKMQHLDSTVHIASERAENAQRFIVGLRSSVDHIQTFCEDLKLEMSLVMILRIRENIHEAQGYRFGIITELFSRLRERINDELRIRLFLYVPSEKSPFYQMTQLVGQEVQENFPSVMYDFREAGRCFALGRNTACVFHLMRVLELGLTALGKVFGISLARTNWNPAIEQIEKKIREMGADPNKAPTWRDDQEFYAQAASHFMVFKDAWRNYTAHARGKYDEQEAEIILRNVQAFMQKLAMRLSE